MSKFKGMFSKVTATINKGINKYDEVTKKAEVKIMSVCGSTKTMDDAVGDAACKAVELVKCIPTKIKRVMPKKKLDPMTELAQDAELVAVLRWMHENPCIKVNIQVIQEPVVPIVVDGRAPMVKVRTNGNVASKHGVCDERGLRPATQSTLSRLTNFVRRATGAPTAVCIAPNN